MSDRSVTAPDGKGTVFALDNQLLFIPGSFAFEDGRRHLSISRIFVSTMDSVVNGRRNWGIPKEVAQFDVRYGDEGLDRVSVSRDGKTFAELDFKSWPLPLPFSTALLPGSMHTLGQHADGRHFIGFGEFLLGVQFDGDVLSDAEVVDNRAIFAEDWRDRLGRPLWW